MFGIGLPELLVIMAVALIVVGPDKLPEMAKSVARGVLELKKAIQELQQNVESEVGDVGDIERWSQDLESPPPQLTSQSPLSSDELNQAEKTDANGEFGVNQGDASPATSDGSGDGSGGVAGSGEGANGAAKAGPEAAGDNDDGTRPAPAALDPKTPEGKAPANHQAGRPKTTTST